MSLKTSLAGATAAIGLTALAYPAQAALYNFTYTNTDSTITVTGKLTGTAVGNLITVTNFSDLKYNATDLSSWIFTQSVTEWGSVNTDPPTVNLDGTGANILFGATSGLAQYFTLGPDNFGNGPGLAFTSTGLTPNTNGLEQPFGTLTVTEISQQPIPEPSAVVALLGLGLGALASKVRKQG